MHLHELLTIKLISLIVSIIFIVLFPFILILLLPIYIFRFLVEKSAKYFRPDLGKILTTRSTVFSALKVHSPSPELNLVSVGILKGKLELERAVDLLNLKLNKTTAENGDFRYPELRQYIHKWMGFTFWKWDKNFDLKNHITFLSPQEEFTPADAKTMREKLLIKAFPSKRSPWEIVIVQNYVDKEFDGPKSIVFWRFHHSVCDGFSMLKVVLDVTQSTQDIADLMQKLKKETTGSVKKVFIEIVKLFKFPYEMAKIIFSSYSKSPWGVKEKEYAKDYHCLTSQRISIDFIRSIKSGFDVGFTSVLLSAMTVVLRKAIQIQSEKLNINIPEYMLLVMPLPVPGHPDKLRNYMTAAIMELPVDETDSKQRLKKCHKTLLDAKNSSIPSSFFLMWPILGGLFYWLIKSILSVHSRVAACTSFPGPKEIQSYAGHDALDTTAVFSMPPGNVGVGFAILSYVGGIRFTLIVDKALFSESEGQIMLDTVMNELNLLSSSLV